MTYNSLGYSSRVCILVEVSFDLRFKGGTFSIKICISNAHYDGYDVMMQSPGDSFKYQCLHLHSLNLNRAMKVQYHFHSAGIAPRR